MKKMLMFVYNYLSTDARVQRSAIAISDNLSMELVALKDGYSNSKFKIVGIDGTIKFSVLRYFKFVVDVVRYASNKKYDYIYAHDLYTALPALILKFFNRGKKYIYDAHETIFPQKDIHFSKRDYFFYFFEKAYIKRADLIICAQQKRGEIMREHYNLKITPVTIQNISTLEKSDEVLPNNIQQQCDEFFSRKGKTIVYAGGLNSERKLCALIKAGYQLKDKCKVLLIGGGNQVQQLKQLVEDNGIDNCMFIDTVPYKNLAQILARCDIGYVSYPMTDINNIYCASNKVFEYASLNLPIVASYNLTISDVLSQWQIGECSDNLIVIIDKVIKNLDYYKSNIESFNNNNNWNDEANKLVEILLTLNN